MVEVRADGVAADSPNQKPLNMLLFRGIKLGESLACQLPLGEHCLLRIPIFKLELRVNLYVAFFRDYDKAIEKQAFVERLQNERERNKEKT